MAVEDTTHHTFWQRLTRWLVDGVPDRVMVTPTPDRVQKGEPVTLTADVRRPGVSRRQRRPHHGACRRRRPASVEDVPMEWTVEHDGEYRARFTPAEDGLYRIAVDGTSQAGKDVGRGTVNLRVAPSDAEYFDAAMRAPLLRASAGRDRRAGSSAPADTARPRGRDQLQRPGRHGRRRARAVGHADHPGPAPRSDGRRVAVPQAARRSRESARALRGDVVLGR